MIQSSEVFGLVVVLYPEEIVVVVVVDVGWGVVSTGWSRSRHDLGGSGHFRTVTLTDIRRSGHHWLHLNSVTFGVRTQVSG